MTSLAFLSANSVTRSSDFLVRLCTSSLPLSRSSSVISLAFSAWSKCLLASRRTLRMATLDSCGLLDARHHFLALLAAHRRHGQADHFAVVAGRHAQVAGADRLFDVLEA